MPMLARLKSRRNQLTLAAMLLAASAAPAMAQDPAPAGGSFFKDTEISGFVDSYYSYNFNTPKSACATVGGVAVFNCLRNFDVAHNSFSLNLAELAIEKKPTAMSRGGFRVDFNYGPTAALVNAFEPNGATSLQNVQQAYISYLAPVGTGLQFDFGKFVTMMGNEVIETKDNWNYSRSLLFALAIPYYHTGMRVSYSPSDKVTLGAHLVNGWNNVSDNNSGKSVGGSITIKPTSALTIIENYMTGPEQTGSNSPWRNTSDTIVTYTVDKKTSLAVNYDYGKDGAAKWQGVAGYVKYQANDWFALSPRFEYYDDSDAFSTGVSQKLKDVTVTGEFKHKDGVIFRVEYRGDFSDKNFFIKNASGTVKNQNSLTFGFIYAFSSKS